MGYLSYYMSMYTNSSFLVKFFFAVLAGVFHHLSMAHILHDASHFCYGSDPRIWEVLHIFGGTFTGLSMYVWLHRHCVGLIFTLMSVVLILTLEFTNVHQIDQ